MSFSKIKKLRDNIKRDSFSDRVCDELSEVILQFLPIEDKFRFECVSKQFQRTIYEKHYELFIEPNICGISLTNFETIVRKLPNIKSIKCWAKLNDSEIDLIIKYCNQLNKFEISSKDIISESFEKFFNDKISIKLTLSHFCLKSKPYIRGVSNIEEISHMTPYNVPETIVEVFSHLKIKAKSLRKVLLTFPIHDLQQFLVNEIKYFDTFFHNNKSITHLSLIFVPMIENQLIDLNIGIVSQLSQLISLKIQCYSKFIELKSLTNHIKLFSVKCLKLKLLSLRFYQINDDLKNKDFMSVVKNFQELKRFEFIFNIYSGNSTEFEDYFISSLKTGFKNLTHITIGFNIENSIHRMNETFLETITNNLPKLQNLIIKNKIRVTERTADILSQLSNLEALELNIRNKSFNDSFKNIIIEKCRKIKSIKL